VARPIPVEHPVTITAREGEEVGMTVKLLKAMSPQQHLDRLSAIDAGFLAQEKPNTHIAELRRAAT